MIIATTVATVREQVEAWKRDGLTIGLVPTMGFLHEGHESLVEHSVSDNDRTIVSVFVNPIQFGPAEDFETYPHDFDRDCKVCEDNGASLVFHPAVEEMYTSGFCTYVDMDTVTETLCGAKRPGHFRGVCTVVMKLMHITDCDRAYFGQKDAQQLAVVRRMVRDLDMDVEVVGCPIVRESDGLAKSSRNTYLLADERVAALVLSRAISEGRKLVFAGEMDAARLIASMGAIIEAEPMARIDYVAVVDGVTMQPVEAIGPGTLIAMAVYIGSTRLIDNFVVGE